MTRQTPTTPANSQTIRSMLWTLAVLLHLLGLLLYLDWKEILTNPPVADTDFANHWAAVWTTSHFLDNGRFWGYDPAFMAGHPEGTLLNIDNHLFEVASWVISQAGLSLPLSYNLVLAATMFLAPLAVYPAAHWLGLSRDDAALAQLAALALWYLDPTLRWGWEGGTFAFLAAVPLALLVTAAAVRLTAPEPHPGLAAWLCWFGLGPLLFWLHSLTFGLLLVPLIILSWRRLPSISRRSRLLLLLWPPLVWLVSLPWLIPALRFLWSRTHSNYYLQGGFPALAADLLGIGYVDGASTVSLLGLRWLVLFVGGLGLWWVARHSDGALVVAVTAVTAFFVAYGAVHLPGGGDLQPYRFIEQATLWSAIGLGPGGRQLRAWSTVAGRPAATVLGLVVLLWVAHGAWQFRPPPLGGPIYHQWQGPSSEAKALCSHLRSLPLDQGRVLIDDARIGALLPWCSGAEVIGGPFSQIWTQYGFANATPWDFAGVLYHEYTMQDWQSNLETYNVRWIIANGEWNHPDWYTLADWLTAHPESAHPGPRFGPYQFYELNRPSNPIRVEADHTGLHVSDAPSASSFVLPYHWLPTLETRPPTIRIRPQLIGHDPIPFILVQETAADTFLICNQPQCPVESEAP